MDAIFTGFQGQALLAGLVIGLVHLGQTYLRWYAPHVPWNEFHHALERWQAHAGSRILSQALELFWSLGAPLVMLFLGYFSTQDIGIPLPDWELVLPWVAVTLGAALAWICWLWGRHWFRHAEERPHPEYALFLSSLPALLVHVLSQEGYLATARAALMPTVGAYWGVWAGIAGKIIVTFISPNHRVSLRTSGKRDLVLLDWSTDLVSGALFVLTGSIVVTCASRLVISGVLWLAARWLPRAKAPVSE